MPSRIVTSVHRPKRPPPKRKATALQVPAIVRKAKSGNDTGQRKAEQLPTAEKKPRSSQDAADAMWVDLVRLATGKDRP
jgi:hypothetical protein